jgi:hypothetical protein
MKPIRSILKLTLLSMALAISAGVASGQTIESSKVYLMGGLLNFTRGQAAAIDFCNVDRVARDVRLYFLDVNGNILKTAMGRVAPGQSIGLNFSFGELPRSSLMRVGIRGVVVIADPPGGVDPPDPDLSLANMEIYDVLTGRTSFGLLMPAVLNLNVYFPTDQ